MRATHTQRLPNELPIPPLCKALFPKPNMPYTFSFFRNELSAGKTSYNVDPFWTGCASGGLRWLGD